MPERDWRGKAFILAGLVSKKTVEKEQQLAVNCSLAESGHSFLFSRPMNHSSLLVSTSSAVAS